MSTTRYNKAFVGLSDFTYKVMCIMLSNLLLQRIRMYTVEPTAVKRKSNNNYISDDLFLFQRFRRAFVLDIFFLHFGALFSTCHVNSVSKRMSELKKKKKLERTLQI